MHILSRYRALLALVCLLIMSFTVYPLAASAQGSPGTILFSRTIYGTVGGVGTPTSSAIFTIGDDGLHERTLTPYSTGTFNIPSVARDRGYNWLTNAFNPAGTWSIFLQAQERLPEGEPPNFHGKFYIVNSYGLRTPALFSGANDLQSASVGPSYGSVSWGPAGNDQIAYAHNPDNLYGAHPACVSLMHSDGTHNHKLWCASTWYYCAIEAIRWSGDGSTLTAFAVRTDRFANPEADLYAINTTTGAATLVEANIAAPYSGVNVSDISYDGHEVIYGVLAATNDPGPCHASDPNAAVWCAKNLITGKMVALVDPSNVVELGGGSQPLISPDGTEAYLGSFGIDESDIYAVKTDGSGVRQITTPCITLAPFDTSKWDVVRVSPDNTRILANCHTYTPATDVAKDQIFVVNLTNGSTRFITDGDAYDWHAIPQ